MSEVNQKRFNFKLLQQIWVFVKPHHKKLWLALLLTLLLAAIAPLRPYLTQLAIDNLALGSYTLLRYSIFMFGVLLMQAALQFSFSYLANIIAQDAIFDLRASVFKAISTFKVSYFDGTPVGVLVTRLVSDMETIADIFSDGLLLIVSDIMQMIVIIGFMFYVDWRLALLSLSTLPFLILATRIFQQKIKASFNDVRNQVAALNTFVQEHISGMRIVQLFNHEDVSFKQFEKINKAHRKAHIRSVWYYSIFFPVVEILSALAVALLVWWGASAAIKSNVSFGTITAFIIYVNMLFRPIRELADKFNTLQMGMVSGERVFKLLQQTDKSETSGNVSAKNIKGNIRFENVWFAYKDENWVLRNVTFSVNAGQMIAFVGATGAGKTSIINLLNRYYEIQQGAIYIDDVNIKDYNLMELRQAIGLVQQEVFLFSDSIANNISLFNESISMDEIIQASKAIGANNFIEKMPGNYLYNVQERGALLSVGQRQLIAFIRAYIYKPAIFILDEATSSLDSESEVMISQATNAIVHNRTSVVIAHRLSTIQNADVILVMDKGQIIEQGNHETLLTHNGVYKSLYDIQFNTVQPT
ncbi:MAG: ABC transporter ATP-binding protein [Bacteroidia bacterium]|nr:ABC transporter ATP-binding protein [Bacteroidia bacterium]HQU99696.1 ABC transporter ATP-binding protein [Bacteroidia bacterium]